MKQKFKNNNSLHHYFNYFIWKAMNTEALAELSAALLKANIDLPISRIELIVEEFILLKAQINLINKFELKPEPSNVFNVTLRSDKSEQ